MYLLTVGDLGAEPKRQKIGDEVPAPAHLMD
jgi:hypothetical protein